MKDEAKWTDIAIVILTAVIAGTSYLQWHEIRSGGQDTHDLAVAAKTQAEKMKDMSGAAEKIRQAAEGMVDQEKRIADKSGEALRANISLARKEQRAWLHVTVKPDVRFEAGKPVTIRIQIENTGRTPALRVRWVVEHISRSKDTSPDFTFPWPSFKEADLQQVGVVTPSATVYTDAMISAIAPDEAEAIRNLKLRVYIFGRAEYSDVYQRRHWLNFCMYWLPYGDFSLCKEHNDMDQEKIQAKAN